MSELPHTATLAGQKWLFQKCDDCSGTGSTSRTVSDGNFHNGRRRIVSSCRFCEGRGLTRQPIATTQPAP